MTDHRDEQGEGVLWEGEPYPGDGTRVYASGVRAWHSNGKEYPASEYWANVTAAHLARLLAASERDLLIERRRREAAQGAAQSWEKMLNDAITSLRAAEEATAAAQRDLAAVTAERDEQRARAEDAETEAAMQTATRRDAEDERDREHRAKVALVEAAQAVVKAKQAHDVTLERGDNSADRDFALGAFYDSLRALDAALRVARETT